MCNVFATEELEKEEKSCNNYQEETENDNLNSEYRYRLMTLSELFYQKIFDEFQEKGLKVFTEAAEQGDAYAQEVLSAYYSCIENDGYREIEWCKKAAEQGSVEALHNLGLSYLKGKFIEFNEEEGLRCLNEAYRRGNPSSKQVIDMYKAGMFESPNNKK